MLPLAEIIELYENLVRKDADPKHFDRLDKIDFETNRVLLMIAKHRDAEAYLYDRLSGIKRNTFTSNELTTVLISKSLHGPAYNADSIKWLGLPTIYIALFHAYLLEADLYNAAEVAGSVNDGYKLIAERFGLKPNAYRTEWIKVKNKRARQGQKNIIKYIDAIQDYLNPEARKIAINEREEFLKKQAK
jgi:hypothetical protein